MMIILGKRERRLTLGYVADLCLACLRVRKCQLQAINEVLHLYFIPIGSGSDTDHVGECADCRRQWRVDPRSFPGIEPTSDLSLDDLVAQTGRPDLVERAQYAAEFAHRVKRRQFLPEDREVLIARSLVLREESGVRSSDALHDVYLACLLVAIPAALVWVICQLVIAGPQSGWTWVAVSACVGATLLLIRAIATVGPRYARTRLEPAMARELRELRPTAGEIRKVCESLAKQGHVPARYINATRLEQFILGG